MARALVMRQWSLSLISGVLRNEASASPVVRMGRSVIVRATAQMMIALTVLNTITIIARGRLYSSLQFPGTFSARQ